MAIRTHKVEGRGAVKEKNLSADKWRLRTSKATARKEAEPRSRTGITKWNAWDESEGKDCKEGNF